MENIKITSYTGTSPLLLDGAKLHLNILDDSFDTIIQSYIDAANQLLYSETNILIDGSAMGYLRGSDPFTVPIGDVDTLAIYYYDSANTRTLLDTDDYTVTYGAYTEVVIDTIPNVYDRLYPYEVEITTKEATDPSIIQCLRMIVGDFFESRQSTEMGTHSEVSRTTRWQLDLISKRFNL